MKKILIIAILVFMSSLYTNHVNAGDYFTYQETEFEHDSVKFLDDYTQANYDKYYKKVEKRRFWGWRVYTKYKTEKMFYTKETLYKIYNNGTTAITENMHFEKSNSVKKQYNVSGSIGLDGSGDVQQFKLGLDSKLAHSITATTTTTMEEEFDIRVYIDPGTTLLVEVKGEGNISNGVAAYYVFWKCIKKGGWEVFTVTTEYYSLVKEQIDAS